jgi:hypothetical protein
MRKMINHGGCETKRLRAHNGLHGDASFELFDNVTRLFLLVPADKSIEHKNSNLNIRAEQREISLGK